MEIHTIRVKAKWDEPIYIAPLSDIQYQGKGGPSALGHLKRYIDRATSLNAIWVGLGDYIDFASPSNRQRLREASLYDSAEDVLDKAATDLVDELYRDYLKPLTGKVAGLLHGHHYYNLRNGTTSDQYLCSLLKTKFLGTCAYVRIILEMHSTKMSLILWMHHGAGGGSKSYAPLVKLENTVAHWAADVMLVAHMSKMASTMVNRIEPVFHPTGGAYLRHRNIHLVGTGSFSTAYQLDARQGNVPQDGYVGQKMLNPACIGAPLIRVTPIRHRKVKNYKEETRTELQINVET